ncbi:hypothetical protein [Plantibacter sp. RU18]|uniref:hypothetical protein n=1 Tax=Plantibacter sp. RU18 TaxID=3158143 RepID=UPI003D35BA73
MAGPRRARASLRNPILAGYTIEQDNKDAFARMAAAAGISASAMLDAMIEHTETKPSGEPIWWTGPEEATLINPD